MKKKFLFVIIFLLWLFSGRNYLQEKFPYTHDGENHLARFANYKIAIKEGQFPPRFAPNLVNHYGYPVFNYNYPLANIISIPFSLLKINYEITFKIIAMISMAIGFWGIFQWIKRKNASDVVLLMSALIFSLNPYLSNIIFYRGNIGELMALCLLPWLFYNSEVLVSDFFAKENYQKINYITFSIFLWTIFFLAHNIFALFGSVLIGGYTILNLLTHKQKSLKVLLLYGGIFLGGILLSLWFWLPAITEKSQVVLDNSSFFSESIKHVSTLSQLIFSPLNFGFSRISSVDDLSFSLGLVQVFSIVIAVIYYTRMIILKKFKFNNFFILTIIALTLIILQSQYSLFFWQKIPLASYIQFPWRLGMLLSIVVIPVFANIFPKLSIPWKIFFIFLFFIQFLSQLFIKSPDYFHRQNIDYDAYSQSTTTLHENMPKTFLYANQADWKPSPTIISGEAVISFELEKGDFWSGSKRQYTLKVFEDSLIVEPTMNFLGWETYVETGRSESKIQYINNDEIKGRIAYKLSPGDYKVTTKFTQNTVSRIIGNYASLSFLVLLLIAFFVNNIKYKND